MGKKNGKTVIKPHNEPLWYKDAIIYELHVRAFHDSDGDGYGDFRGLTEKLDYLQDLGVTAIWLLPFYPSPLRDDGYDIADYNDIHPLYGNLRDFRQMMKEATRRDIKVINELVVNHTSDQHPWFKRARMAAPGSPERDFYVWNDTDEKYKDARIIFKDFEASNWTWDKDAKAYYWHRFFSHQPDLNFENPKVKRALFQVLDFWLEMGISGMRLDAVPYLYEEEGTICENLPRTYEFIGEMRRYIDKKYGGRMLLAEANQWPEDAALYLGEGRGCHMAFHFPLMPRMFMSLQLEDRFPIIDILQQTPAIDETSQWALFLRNHDELTLEMVTDEERDYMYRVYARDLQARINLGIRRRLAPLLQNNRRKVELMNGLLFSLPGTPVIYYGDEIGMGDNIYLGDRNGVRTPMQWSADRNAGFSRANPQQLYLPVIADPEYRFEAINVETQQGNSSSLLWWMKRLIGLRKQFKAFSRGTMTMLAPENRKVLAFIRRWEDEIILVVANLSRFSQYLELDLSEYRGMQPLELFGRTEFPRIGDLPYFITTGPHTFYWFQLRPAEQPIEVKTTRPERRLAVTGSWENLLKPEQRGALERILPEFLSAARWFGGKAKRLKEARVRETIALGSGAGAACLTIIEVEYADADPERYMLPLTFSTGERALQIAHDLPATVIAKLTVRNRQGEEVEGLLHDALTERTVSELLLRHFERRRRLKGQTGEVVFRPGRAFAAQLGEGQNLEPSIMRAEQSNTSVLYGDRMILKFFRRLEEGVNPDLEIGRFLTERRRFEQTPPVLGAVEFEVPKAEPITLAILQGYVPNEGDAWQYTLDTLGSYFERVMTDAATRENSAPRVEQHLTELMHTPCADQACELLGHYQDMARLLGRRTAEMHLALASDGPGALATEPMTQHYQRSLYQSMRNMVGQSLHLLQRQMRTLPEESRKLARQVLESEGRIMTVHKRLLERRLTARRIRIHGDYHLGQVLYTGRDFVILDFEGEPARSLTERRLRRSALRDVAGMLRSFHYAAYTVYLRLLRDGMIAPDQAARVESWAHYWYEWIGALFLRDYLEVASKGSFMPRSQEELRVLLDAYMLDKALYELGYELNSRPDWTPIPMRGILELAGPEPAA